MVHCYLCLLLWYCVTREKFLLWILSLPHSLSFNIQDPFLILKAKGKFQSALVVERAKFHSWKTPCSIQTADVNHLVYTVAFLNFILVSGCFAFIYVCVCSVCGGQKKALDPLELALPMVVSQCGCWKSNPGPLTEQPIFLATKPSLQTTRHF